MVLFKSCVRASPKALVRQTLFKQIQVYMYYVMIGISTCSKRVLIDLNDFIIIRDLNDIYSSVKFYSLTDECIVII